MTAGHDTTGVGQSIPAVSGPGSSAVAEPWMSSAVSTAWVLGPEDRGQPAGRVFALVLHGQLQDFRRHEPGVRSDLDPVHLHDFRVALRRARSLLGAGREVFPDASRRELVGLMRLLASVSSEVRDLDVLIAAVERRSASVSPELGDGTRLLRAALQLRRSTELTAMLDLLGGDHYLMMLRRWHQLGSVYRLGGGDPGPQALRPTGEVVDAAITAAMRRVRRAGRTAHSSDELEDWHTLRIRLKRLRYLVVAFESLYPEGSLGLVTTRLRKLQNVLGRLQDHATEIELIESVGVHVGGRAALSAGVLSDQLHHATARDLQRCAGAWTGFDHREVGRQLREVIATSGRGV